MHWFLIKISIIQTGDSGSYLASLAATLADDLRTNFSEVLAQLEDLRLAEWADQAPPPPSRPRHALHQQQQQSPAAGHAHAHRHQPPGHASQRQAGPGLHNYANYPSKVEYLFYSFHCRFTNPLAFRLIPNSKTVGIYSLLILR